MASQMLGLRCVLPPSTRRLTPMSCMIYCPGTAEDNQDVNDTMILLQEMRKKRDIEEKKHKAQMQAKFAAAKAIEDEERAKVLAVIEARRKIEQAEKEKKKDQDFKESQARMATEMTFNFSWG